MFSFFTSSSKSTKEETILTYQLNSNNISNTGGLINDRFKYNNEVKSNMDYNPNKAVDIPLNLPNVWWNENIPILRKEDINNLKITPKKESRSSSTNSINNEKELIISPNTAFTYVKKSPVSINLNSDLDLKSNNNNNIINNYIITTSHTTTEVNNIINNTQIINSSEVNIQSSIPKVISSDPKSLSISIQDNVTSESEIVTSPQIPFPIKLDNNVFESNPTVSILSPTKTEDSALTPSSQAKKTQLLRMFSLKARNPIKFTPSQSIDTLKASDSKKNNDLIDNKIQQVPDQDLGDNNELSKQYKLLESNNDDSNVKPAEFLVASPTSLARKAQLLRMFSIKSKETVNAGESRSLTPTSLAKRKTSFEMKSVDNKLLNNTIENSYNDVKQNFDVIENAKVDNKSSIEDMIISMEISDRKKNISIVKEMTQIEQDWNDANSYKIDKSQSILVDSFVEAEKQRRMSIEAELNDQTHSTRMHNRSKTQAIFEAEQKLATKDFYEPIKGSLSREQVVALVEGERIRLEKEIEDNEREIRNLRNKNIELAEATKSIAVYERINDIKQFEIEDKKARELSIQIAKTAEVNALSELIINEQNIIEQEKLEIENKRKYVIKLIENERKSRIESDNIFSEQELTTKKINLSFAKNTIKNESKHTYTNCIASSDSEFIELERQERLKNIAIANQLIEGEKLRRMSLLSDSLEEDNEIRAKNILLSVDLFNKELTEAKIKADEASRKKLEAMSNQSKLLEESRIQAEDDSRVLLLELSERKKSIALVNELESIEQMRRMSDWKEATSCNYDYSQIVMADSLEIEEQRRRVHLANEALRESEELRLQNRLISEDLYYTEKASIFRDSYVPIKSDLSHNDLIALTENERARLNKEIQDNEYEILTLRSKNIQLAHNQKTIAKSEHLNEIINYQNEEKSNIENNILIANNSEAIALKEAIFIEEEEDNKNKEEIESTRKYIKKLMDDEQLARVRGNAENESYAAREVRLYETKLAIEKEQKERSDEYFDAVQSRRSSNLMSPRRTSQHAISNDKSYFFEADTLKMEQDERSKNIYLANQLFDLEQQRRVSLINQNLGMETSFRVQNRSLAENIYKEELSNATSIAEAARLKQSESIALQAKAADDRRKQIEDDDIFLIIESQELKKNIELVNELERVEQESRAKEWVNSTVYNVDHSQVQLADKLEKEELNRRLNVESESLKEALNTRLHNRRLSQDIFKSEQTQSHREKYIPIPQSDNVISIIENERLRRQKEMDENDAEALFLRNKNIKIVDAKKSIVLSEYIQNQSLLHDDEELARKNSIITAVNAEELALVERINKEKERKLQLEIESRKLAELEILFKSDTGLQIIDKNSSIVEVEHILAPIICTTENNNSISSNSRDRDLSQTNLVESIPAQPTDVQDRYIVKKEAVRNKFMKKTSISVDNINPEKEFKSPLISPSSAQSNESVAQINTAGNKEAVRSKFMRKPSQHVPSVDLTNETKIASLSPNLLSKSITDIKSSNTIAAPKLSELAAFCDDEVVVPKLSLSKLASFSNVGELIAAPKLSELSAFDDDNIMAASELAAFSDDISESKSETKGDVLSPTNLKLICKFSSVQYDDINTSHSQINDIISVMSNENLISNKAVVESEVNQIVWTHPDTENSNSVITDSNLLTPTRKSSSFSQVVDTVTVPYQKIL